MNPYYAVKEGRISLEVEVGDVVFQLSHAEWEYSEAIINYFLQVAKEEHKPMLEELLSYIRPTELH